METTWSLKWLSLLTMGDSTRLNYKVLLCKHLKEENLKMKVNREFLHSQCHQIQSPQHNAHARVLLDSVGYWDCLDTIMAIISHISDMTLNQQHAWTVIVPRSSSDHIRELSYTWVGDKKQAQGQEYSTVVNDHLHCKNTIFNQSDILFINRTQIYIF
jgi:hypothetical protein